MYFEWPGTMMRRADGILIIIIIVITAIYYDYHCYYYYHYYVNGGGLTRPYERAIQTLLKSRFAVRVLAVWMLPVCSV